MDWSKAKTILILAFLALNLFLAAQLLQARNEQSDNINSAKDTRRELAQLLQDKEITVTTDLPSEPPRVTYLEAKPAPPDNDWESNTDGSYERNLQPAPEAGTSLHRLNRLLRRYVDHFDDFQYDPGESSSDRKVYYQYWGDRPLFDARLQVRMKGDRVESLHLVRFKINDENSSPQQGVTSHTALLSLIENRRIQKGSTITSMELGYHGPSYDAEVRILHPVWRIKTVDKTYYVNALTGGSDTAMNTKKP
ncbi:two-component system regulatory protein YycI [Paludifilum halophilum]|uniref:Regulatory protein YycH-like domain-containing protein n=1 Tax=Paludifilum halophilum TaxID=1642702 RepID=A0A235B7W5_9BACL|nr:two-component system regulatory protein YycI [Paludifilum halophilum]OYD07947.1 hypothetical protein CHM34_07435 [Paludifilum halophilum]